ncbi:MAG: sulfite oxidase heme-binding subunit YedZ, partial [bacterium]
MKPSNKTISWRIKPILFLAGLLPFLAYSYGLLNQSLGANPIEEITRASGDWALRLLLITLAVTPLRRITGWNWLLRFRRMLGLFSFFYAAMHFALYVWLDQFFSWEDILEDIIERPFITVGFLAFLVLGVLAATSPKWAMRKLGARWATVHKSVYLAAIASVLHFWWMKSSKSDISEPLLYSLILGGLFAVRLYYKWR